MIDKIRLYNLRQIPLLVSYKKKLKIEQRKAHQKSGVISDGPTEWAVSAPLV
jgi:hypothetical protein